MPALRAWCNAGALFSTIMPSLRDFRFADRPPFRSFRPSCCRSIVPSCQSCRRAVVNGETRHGMSLLSARILLFSLSPFPVFSSTFVQSCLRAVVPSCPRAVVLSCPRAFFSQFFPNVAAEIFSFEVNIVYVIVYGRKCLFKIPGQ